MVIRQYLDDLGLSGYFVSTRQHRNIDRGIDGLLQVGQIRVVWLEFDGENLSRFTGSKTVKSEFCALGEPRVASDKDFQPFQSVVAMVGQSQGANYGDRVLD